MRKITYVVGSCLLGLLTASNARAQSVSVSGTAQAVGPANAQGTSAGANASAQSTASGTQAAPLPPGGLAPAPAQTNTPYGASSPGAASGVEPSVSPASPAPSTPPAAPAAPPGTLEKTADALANLFRFYGTLKPTLIASVGSLESFSQPNATAETAAGNPALATLPKETRGTFQVGQSRVGLWVAEKSTMRGHLEIDFVDFTKASPTVASVPRLRIATVEWEPVDKLTFTFGQDWDLFGPVNPYGSNLVGAHFLAGNTGFMRQQIKTVYTIPDTVELGFALGLQGVNATAKEGAVELARVPTGAVRAAALFGKSRVGVAGIATQLRLAPGTPAERRTGTYAGQVYADVDVSSAIHLKAEGYIGRNLAAIGLLALSQPSTASGDLDEIGGFLSAKAQANEHHAVYLTVGAAQILNSDDVVPSYAYAAPTTPGGPAGAAALAGTGPGMRFNSSARIGYELRIAKPLAFQFEAFVFRSRHVLAPTDIGRFDSMRTVPGGEIAAVYTF
jgi:hypothetical protein